MAQIFANLNSTHRVGVYDFQRCKKEMSYVAFLDDEQLRASDDAVERNAISRVPGPHELSVMRVVGLDPAMHYYYHHPVHYMRHETVGLQRPTGFKCGQTPDPFTCTVAAVMSQHNQPLPVYRDPMQQISAMVGWSDPHAAAPVHMPEIHESDTKNVESNVTTLH